MWDKWKKRIQNFIWKEVEVDSEEGSYVESENFDQHHDQKQPIQTRMVYQYPDKKPFKFPVIPDDPPLKQSLDTPAYKRRKVEDEQQSQTHSVISEKPFAQKQAQKTEKVYKKDESRPFKPSRVASPIYGYQERKKEKEIHEVPAYIRKPRTQDITMEANKKEVEPTHLVVDERTLKPEKTISKDPETISSKGINIQHEKVEKEREEEKDVAQQTNKKTEIPDPTIDKAERLPKEDKRTHEQDNIPFNVIMTPRDKKYLFEKRKDQRSSVNNKQKFTERSPEVNEHEMDSTLPHNLLDEPTLQGDTNDLWVEEQKGLLEKTLKYFKVRATVVNATQGPSVTRFEVKPELGVKVSRIRNLSDDLKLNMAAKDIRIEAPIPGKNTVGIEVPNPKAQMVGLQEIFETSEFRDSPSPLTIALGLNIEGAPIITNIQKMPHGLIAGATGSGKSVCINTILISLLYKASHKDVKLILIDPKMVELTQYNGIPHLVSPVITDVKAATAALKWAVNEMEERYEKFVNEGVRNIEKYNQKINERGDKKEKMPFIVIVIDELADLMMVSPQDVEDSISRIAQKARACGIHLLLATQRPSVDVITGLIKANIPTRIAFSVSSQVDSRTIVDVGGAEKLLGKGDMLFVENGTGKGIRLQGAFVSDEEIDRVTSHARKIAKPNYLFEQETLLEKMTTEEEKDELLQEAIDFVMAQNSASTSMLQRHFKIGYNRAARLIDSLEQKGIISSQNGSKPRDILVTQSELETMYTS